MRYDMKYKKLNVEDNESCNLQCEKKCEKLAGVFICCILAFFLLFLSTRNVGLIYCYADELSEDSENTAEDAEQEQQKIKETILSEFEYGEIDDSLRSLFPEKRIAFQEVISEILTGDLKSSVKLLTEFAGEQMFYLLQTGKKNLVHILLIAMIAAFMNQFAGTLQNRQVASVGFYMIYILLAALTVAAFDVVIQWVESGIRNITAFMGVFYPVYFLAVAVAKGSVTGVAFYNLVLFLIYAVEIIIGNVLLPMVRVYMIIRVLNFLTFFFQFTGPNLICTIMINLFKCGSLIKQFQYRYNQHCRQNQSQDKADIFLESMIRYHLQDHASKHGKK